jgi:hypothetical protein
MSEANHAEPPSSSLLRRPLFMIGQDERGNWVVQDESGICGGLFINRAAALRYIRAENDYRTQAVVMISGILELDMTRGSVLRSWSSVAEGSERRRIA